MYLMLLKQTRNNKGIVVYGELDVNCISGGVECSKCIFANT